MIEKLYSLYLKHQRICTDTRKAQKGSIFFALKGEHFNGNEFAAEAIEKGCAYAVIDAKEFCQSKRYIVVNNALNTLQELAKHHRKKLNIPVIGITGTNGKTTTKDLIRVVLSKKFNTSSTKGNFNNHIGVPLSILEINKEIEIAVIEMGASRKGEIAELCNIARPGYGIITNIGKAHLEGFGSLEGVKQAKKELYDYVKKNDGIIFLNSDDQILVELAPVVQQITYGSTGKGANCKGRLLNIDPFISLSWKTSKMSKFSVPAATRLVGRYNFENLLAAVCIGKYFKVPDINIRKALEEYQPENNRSQLIKKNGNTIVLDAYNANPVSMAAAIENLSEMEGDRKVLILGDMLELGNYSAKEHQAIADLVIEKNFAEVFLVGAAFSAARKRESCRCFGNANDLKRHFISSGKVFRNAIILIKGSRGIQLEQLLEAL